MDRYGASARGYESDDGDSDDYPRRGGPRGALDRDDDYNRGYSRGNLTRERGTFRGERSGRDHRSGLYDDHDSDHGHYGLPTHRRGTGPSQHEPRDGYRGGADGGAGPGHRGLFPSTRDSSDNESECEHGDREVRGQRLAHGAASYRPGPRYTGDHSDDESDSEPLAPRGGHGGSGAGRGADPRRRPDRRLHSEYSDDDSDFGPQGSRSMAPPHADHRGAAYTDGMNDRSENGPYGGLPPGYGRGSTPRGGMTHPRRRHGRGALSDDDDDVPDEPEYEDRRRRGAISYGRGPH